MSGSVDRAKGGRMRVAARERSEVRQELESIADLVRNNDRGVRRSLQLALLEEVLQCPHFSENTIRFFASWRTWLVTTPGSCLSAEQERTLACKASTARRLAASGAPVLTAEEWAAKATAPRVRRVQSFRKARAPLAAFFSDPSLLPKKPPTRRTS